MESSSWLKEKYLNDNDENYRCEFRNQRMAMLYCRADSAKLCLVCDQQVHSANTVSNKHLRTQICDVCASQPASVRCFTHNDALLLCHDCDLDLHSSCSGFAPHDRDPVNAFSGCPSATQLSSLWGFGFDLNPNNNNLDLPSFLINKPHHPSFDDFDWSDLLVPSPSQYPEPEALPFKRHNNKQKQQLLIKQLTELQSCRVIGEDLDEDEDEHEAADADEDRYNSVVPAFVEHHHGLLLGSHHHHQINHYPSISILRPQQPNLTNNNNNNVNVSAAHPVLGPTANVVCRATSINPTRQIWDFNTGCTRGDEESGNLGINYRGTDAGFFYEQIQFNAEGR